MNDNSLEQPPAFTTSSDSPSPRAQQLSAIHNPSSGFNTAPYLFWILQPTPLQFGIQSRPSRAAPQATNHSTMANPLDTDAGSELFSNYEAELKLVQADLSQKLDQITELSGEPRKSAVRLAERSLEEANELVCPTLHIHFLQSQHSSLRKC